MFTKEMKTLADKKVWLPCVCLMLVSITSPSVLLGRYFIFIIICVLNRVMFLNDTGNLFTVKKMLSYTLAFMLMEFIIYLMI